MIFESGHENALDFEDKLDPDCFLSGKVKLLKIIRTDSVTNVTRAYTEIFPNAEKKTTVLTHQRQV